jgi:FlaA1/EpsC-like NDP-sugar epimerase
LGSIFLTIYINYSVSLAVHISLTPKSDITRRSIDMPKLREKKRVLVVGAGAAGMACADNLARHPDRFEVTSIGEHRCDRLYEAPIRSLGG